VTLELTEGGFLQDGERALVVLTELKHVGVKLALDDFGTGYSSLSYLKRFPIDIVKIDQAFISDLDEDRASYAIVCSVIELAHLLDMTVVAEGVESAAQHKQLAALGCDYCQGNYFAGPLSPEHLEYLIRRHNNAGAVYLPALAAAANA
jgi:EAL domain-containing protein (putative c-di-GMP-specific phosphodiesterase class I)